MWHVSSRSGEASRELLYSVYLLPLAELARDQRCHVLHPRVVPFLQPRRCVCSTVVLAGAPICNEHLTRTALNGGFLVVRSAMSNFFSVSFFGYKLHARSLVQFARLADTLLKDEESARDNHALACNFARYSPIERTFSLTDSAINRS